MSGAADYLIEVRGLRTYLFTPAGTARAVDDVSFRIAQGEVLGLVGESGCGKTMTALSLLRLVSPPARVVGGEILFQGRDLLALPEKEMRALRGSAIGMIFQEPASALNPVFTIGYQVGESLQIHKGLTRRQARAEAVAMLREVALPDPERRAGEYPHQLSGGMLQRVMIAMALIGRPALLIADEPTTALDTTIQGQVVDLLLRLREQYRLTILLISHDLGVVAEMADRVAVMYAGRIVEEAATRDLFRSPLHPYTAGLLRSIPGAGTRSAGAGSRPRLHAIEGTVPDLLALPGGCAFAPRCPEAMAVCAVRPPALLAPSRRSAADAPSGPRRVACYLHEPEPESPPPVEGRGWNAASGR